MSTLPEDVRILRHPLEDLTPETIAAARHRPSFTQAGTTQNFVVEYQTRLGAAGAGLADVVLKTCEADYATLQGWFSGLTPPALPCRSLIVRGRFGAFHSTCADTRLHLAAFGLDNGELVEMVNMAEVVEVFEAAQNQGWDCGASNGEGLSRVLATELHPSQLDGFTTAAAWLDQDPRPNFVDVTDNTDQNAVSTGCAVLFLNYLRYQLGYSWAAIVGAAGATLAQTYEVLTAGKTDGWSSFSSLLEASFPPGSPSGVTKDNVFPL
jgi:hypothetical protein